MKRSGQSIVEGALVLGLAAALVKLVGFAGAIPLVAVIGVDGNGYYTAAYNLYGVVYALAVTGLPAAVSQVVAALAADRRYRDIRRLGRVCGLFFALLGLLLSAALAALSSPYAQLIGQSLAHWCVLAVSPSIFFGCLLAVRRGYWQGLADMRPTALSQIVEVLVKTGFGLAAAYYVKNALSAEYAALGCIMGEPVTAREAAAGIAALSAAGAIAGVSASVAAGWLFMLLRSGRRGQITREQLKKSPLPTPAGRLLGRVIRVGLPVAASSMTVALAGLIDGVTVMGRLSEVAATSSEALFMSHGGLLELAGFTPHSGGADLGNYLYGCYGLAVRLFNLVPALTVSLGMSALPHVAASWAKKELAAVRAHIESVLRMTLLVASPAALGLSALSGPIMQLLFGSGDPYGAAVAGPLLRLLGPAALFVAVVGPSSALLQSVGRADIPVKLMAIGGVLKVAANYFLIGIPQFNVRAAPVGNLICFAFIAAGSLFSLARITGGGLRLASLGRPVLAGLLSASAAALGYELGEIIMPANAAALTAIALAIPVYAVACLKLKTLKKGELEVLPMGKKLAGALAIRGFLG